MTLAARLRDLQPKPPRILTIDVETSPALVWTFDLAADYINPANVVQPTRILCFAAKWHDEQRVQFYGENTHTRRQLVEAMWGLLDEADWVITYNGRRFDLPHIRREFLQLGYRPPSPWIDVDLLPVMRKEFKFLSNRLGFITEQLGLDTKTDTGGFTTWLKVMDGDPAAWKTFERYNKQDVQVTEQLFDYIRAYVRLPHAGLYTGRMHACAACGSDRLVPDGIVRSKVSAWLRLACSECGQLNKMLANGETRAV